ncbi:MAG TPA: 30S ribosome-binding factor RbfA [Verrucomicrobiales bacterium]|nr:30S ribosome-binding factor RbfA [Verrucomicrobiales bacterium]
MKNRLVRVRELLQRELGAILARDHAFPNVLVTVNDVDITPDLKHAYFYIGVIGGEHQSQHVVDVLNRQHGELQTRVAKRVVLKNTPHFHFRLDHSVERGVRVTAIMDTIDRQLAESAARDNAGAPSAPATPVEDDEDFTDEEEEDLTSESADADPDDSEEEEDVKTPKSSVPARRTGPRRSPRDFTVRDEED